MRPVAPAKVLAEIAGAVPADCRENIIIIGSLAVGYHFFGSDPAMMVRTKDADCLLSPRTRAIAAGVEITDRLRREHWRLHADDRWPEPGNASTPNEDLPAVRLDPPTTADWFIELLAVPESLDRDGLQRTRISTTDGDFVLCSFRFLGVAGFEPIPTPLGIHVADPAMMALANLLEHPTIRPDTMSAIIEGRAIKRSNKDLGRVLAIARLSAGSDEDSLLGWPARWLRVLESLFPGNWRTLASHCGDGLRALLESPDDLDEAWHTCQHGLLAFRSSTADQLRIAGLRLLQDAIEPLENLASGT
jgi:hypothetical protein